MNNYPFTYTFAYTFTKALKISLYVKNRKTNIQSQKVQFCVSMTYF